MNAPSLYQAQAEALIRFLRQDQQARCRQKRVEAREWARVRMREARHQARLRFRQAAEKERARFQVEVSAAEAAIAAESRDRHQRHLAAVVSAVIERLPTVLAGRWRNAEQQAGWIAAALAEAQRRLGPGSWRVRVAPGNGGVPAPGQAGDVQMDWQEDPGLAAGLVVEKEGARLDATPGGLLADTTLLQSHILTLLGEVREGARPYE